MKIVFIGSGNLATQVAKALKNRGNDIVQVFSRTEQNAKLLADQVQASWTTNLKNIYKDAELYLFALKDSTLTEVLKDMPATSGVWAHTSGSMPIEVFAPYKKDYGVLYPLQTFSKIRDVDFSKVYIYNEYSSPFAKKVIDKVSLFLSDHIVEMASEKRRKLHLAAVFACNFANHMFVIASDILNENNVDPKGIIPLIDETVAKIHDLSPRDAQTGPAIRYDENVINKHIDMLDGEVLKTIYSVISKNIHKESIK